MLAATGARERVLPDDEVDGKASVEPRRQVLLLADDLVRRVEDLEFRDAVRPVVLHVEGRGAFREGQLERVAARVGDRDLDGSATGAG